MKEMIYLKEYDEINDAILGEKIFPNYIGDFNVDSLTYTFEINENIFQIKKCYKLFYSNVFLYSTSNHIDDLTRRLSNRKSNYKNSFTHVKNLYEISFPSLIGKIIDETMIKKKNLKSFKV